MTALNREEPEKFFILRLKDVKKRTGLNSSTIYERIAEGTFPSQIRLGHNSRAVGWVESEINSWIEQQIQQSRTSPHKQPHKF
jgi:prophage regulatory protein